MHVTFRPAGYAQPEALVAVFPPFACISTAVQQALNFTCIAFGSPSSSYTWDGPAVGTDRAGPANKATLRLTSLRAEDSGMYVCTFSPSSSEDHLYSSTATLRVVGEEGGGREIHIT